ncbi:hypothetical protein HanXRQr2_Chr10g0460691 [Helianthus annuus]|uniref:Uncharacterized protein n=1 Tax=Helianthus annuus TaxID=4232 RepID=A0A9K3I0X0_HELAN|nr:hypothetical protein HanXRQr2_Chr10g0460691 [Helianthus annuus]KAJ0885397.1 hypothetical protein HanPSC8_Chr10g0444781 [Helianthus annuus]
MVYDPKRFKLGPKNFSVDVWGSFFSQKSFWPGPGPAHKTLRLLSGSRLVNQQTVRHDQFLVLFHSLPRTPQPDSPPLDDCGLHHRPYDGDIEEKKWKNISKEKDHQQLIMLVLMENLQGKKIHLIIILSDPNPLF